MRAPGLLLLALAALLPITTSAADPRAPLPACSTACIAEKNHCLAKLGPAAEENCQAGMQICIERCNPRGQNSAAFDAASEDERYRRSTALDAEVSQEVRLCAQRCEVASTQCPRSGTDVNECGLGRQACIDRCYGKQPPGQ